MSESPELLHEAMQRGIAADRMAEYIGEFIDKRVREVETRVFKAIDSGQPLDPQMAVQAWIEVHAAVNLPKSLQKTARRGRDAGKKLKDAGQL